MGESFRDHFAPVAGSYAEYRPTYPAALFDWLASMAPSTELAWDCACGSGQATVDLAGVMDRVIATDASASQIDAAPRHPRIAWRVAPAEHSGLDPASADLITVAQALHWFDLERFYTEVRRVIKPGGVLAVWSYGIHSTGHAAIDQLVDVFYRETVGPWWPPERVHVENGYASLPFPFTPMAAPLFRMTTEWTLADLLGYLRSWSATGRYIRENGHDPVTPLQPQIAPLWGAAERRTITWPLTLKVGTII